MSRIHVLKTELTFPDAGVEFGTVLIYTCSQSCWQDSNPSPRREFVIHQADPDSRLYR